MVTWKDVTDNLPSRSRHGIRAREHEELLKFMQEQDKYIITNVKNTGLILCQLLGLKANKFLVQDHSLESNICALCKTQPLFKRLEQGMYETLVFKRPQDPQTGGGQ
jgi:hypothetical protein